MVKLKGECQRWTGTHRKSDGRPMLGKKYAYRVRWEEKHGPIPPGIILHHLCENAWCMNLRHLKPTTQGLHLKEHSLPGDRHNFKKTTCPEGHPYDYIWTDPKTGRVERGCKTCRVAAKDRYKAKKTNR